MVFRRGRENIRSAALSARSNDSFVFEICVRAPPYPPADFFFLVTSAPLWYSGAVGKISEASRPARDRMTVLFLRLLGPLGFLMAFRRGRENIRSAAPSAGSNASFVFEVCMRAPSYPPADFFSWSPRLPYGIQEGSGKYPKRRAQRAIE